MTRALALAALLATPAAAATFAPTDVGWVEGLGFRHLSDCTETWRLRDWHDGHYWSARSAGTACRDEVYAAKFTGPTPDTDTPDDHATLYPPSGPALPWTPRTTATPPSATVTPPGTPPVAVPPTPRGVWSPPHPVPPVPTPETPTQHVPAPVPVPAGMGLLTIAFIALWRGAAVAFAAASLWFGLAAVAEVVPAALYYFAVFSGLR